MPGLTERPMEFDMVENVKIIQELFFADLIPIGRLRETSII